MPNYYGEPYTFCLVFHPLSLDDLFNRWLKRGKHKRFVINISIGVLLDYMDNEKRSDFDKRRLKSFFVGTFHGKSLASTMSTIATMCSYTE